MVNDIQVKILIMLVNKDYSIKDTAMKTDLDENGQEICSMSNVAL